MTSTLQLVERLKAQLAESRTDLCGKDDAFEEFASSTRSEASAAPTPKEGNTARDCETASCSSRSKPEHMQAQLTALQEELRQKSGSLAAKMVELVTTTKGLSQQLILERQQRLAFEQEVRTLVEAKTSVPSQAAEARNVAWDLTHLKQDVHVLSSRTKRTEEQLEAAMNAILGQLSPVKPCSAPCFGPDCLPPYQDNRLVPRCPGREVPMETSCRQLEEEVAELRQNSEIMQRNLEAAIEAVSCQLSSVTAWVQQKFGECFGSHGAGPPHPAMQDLSAVAARFPQLSPILEDRCVGEDRVAKKLKDGPSEEFNEDLLPLLRLLADDVPQMVKRMTENSQTLLEKINLERADRLSCEAKIGEAVKRLDERVDSIASRPSAGPTLLQTVHKGAVFVEEKGRMVSPCAARPVGIQRCASAPLGPMGLVSGVQKFPVAGPGVTSSPANFEKHPDCMTPRTPRDPQVHLADSLTPRPPAGPTLLHSLHKGAVFVEEKGRMVSPCAARPVSVRYNAAPLGPLGLPVPAVQKPPRPGPHLAGAGFTTPACGIEKPDCMTPRTPREPKPKADGEGHSALAPVARPGQ